MERLFNAVNHDNFGLLVDMGNFACVDENSQTAVSRVAPYAVHAHAKDMHLKSGMYTRPDGWGTTRGGNYFKGAIIGEGDIPVKQCLKALKRAGYDGYLSIEYEGAVDCIKGISKGLANLKQMLSEI
jgi:sugar phosphate isomerase/epimerase